MGAGRGRVLPNIANVNGAALKCIRSVELTPVSIELSYLRRVEKPAFRARAINAPLPRTRVVQTDRDYLNVRMPDGTIDIHFTEISLSLHEWCGADSTVIDFPFVAV